jgi:MoxR-like ATPase
VEAADEIAILSSQENHHPLDDLEPVVALKDIQHLRRVTGRIRVSDEVKEYMVRIVARTRGYPRLMLAASPRASLTLMKTAQAIALFDGREFVTPDDVHFLAADVIAHRLVLESEAKFSGSDGRMVVGEILESEEVPG